jgi:nitrous oxidase accessory protein NosD
MKTHLTKLLLLAAMSSLFAISGYATVIESLPYTISSPGTYTLDGNLTYSGTATAISVAAPNVVIDLRGFTLTGPGPSSGFTNAIDFSNGATNCTVQNGTITGFDSGVSFGSGSTDVVQNLHVLNTNYGVSLDTTSYSMIQNCFIVGASTASIGISLNNDQGVTVKNNQIASFTDGCDSYHVGASSFIANQLANCTVGLLMQTGDKYQGNVTTACTIPFSGGTAVGTENN